MANYRLCLGGAAILALGSLIGARAPAYGQQPATPTPASSAPAISASAPFSQLDPQPVTHKVSAAVDKLQMIVNTSRILTQESRIPQAQVNNPDILGLQALSPNQIQIYGKKPGVTQVNIWDEAGNIHTIDVMVHGDVQELARLLHTTFPKAALRVQPIATGVIISGYVDDPDQQNRIVEVAQNYFPQVINYITIGGVQQVLLQVRVLEVSRTRLRNLGIDMAAILENGSSFGTAGAGILTTSALSAANAIATNGRQTIPIRVSSNGDNFYGFVEALKQNNLAKVLADPNIVTESGRPAFMNAGGEFPVIVPQSLGTVSIEYRRFGTQIDFVPIVMGNGIIHLEVRPRVSEIDDTRSVTINGTQVPGLLVREADVAVNMRAGQTLAIAGLVQTRHNSSVRGIPGLMDVPGIGSFFRRTSVQENEIELLIMVTPQLVEGLDPAQVAALNMPGSQTTSPNDFQKYNLGHIEVPPSNVRPPHFQREYIITPEGVSEVGPGGVAAPAPAAIDGEVVAPPTPSADRAPQTAPEPQATSDVELRIKPLPRIDEEAPVAVPTADDQTSGLSTAPAPAVRSAATSRFVAAGAGAANDAGVVVRGETIRRLPAQPVSVPTQSPAPPADSSGPGLIGPIGYDTVK